VEEKEAREKSGNRMKMKMKRSLAAADSTTRKALVTHHWLVTYNDSP